MGYRHVLYDYASVITEVPECSAGELSAQVGDYAIGNLESMYDLIEEFHSLLRSRFDQWHVLDPLRDLSISTNTNLKLPGAGLNGPIMSRPQQANGQDDRIVWIS